MHLHNNAVLQAYLNQSYKYQLKYIGANTTYLINILNSE